jgi:hypothetical protein
MGTRPNTDGDSPKEATSAPFRRLTQALAAQAVTPNAALSDHRVLDAVVSKRRQKKE